MIEQRKTEERQKRTLEIMLILENRIKEYPYTWHTQTDIAPFMREYYNLTRDPAYEYKKTNQELKNGR